MPDDDNGLAALLGKQASLIEHLGVGTQEIREGQAQLATRLSSALSRLVAGERSSDIHALVREVAKLLPTQLDVVCRALEITAKTVTVSRDRIGSQTALAQQAEILRATADIVDNLGRMVAIDHAQPRRGPSPNEERA